jgi:hypothetical protein
MTARMTTRASNDGWCAYCGVLAQLHAGRPEEESAACRAKRPNELRFGRGPCGAGARSLAFMTTCSTGSVGLHRLAYGVGRQRPIAVWVRLIHPAALTVASMDWMSS